MQFCLLFVLRRGAKCAAVEKAPGGEAKICSRGDDRGGNEYFPSASKKTMETTITTGIDRAIENYRSLHNGSNPLYFIMSAEEADELTNALRQKSGEGNNVIITTYQDIKIIRNSLMERGEYFLGNELPETGS